MQVHSTTYAITDTTDFAIDMMASMPEPWLGWVAYNAPHTPLHVPPAGLSNSFNLNGAPLVTAPDHMRAMVEAVDTEFGRMLAEADPARPRQHAHRIHWGQRHMGATCVDPPFDPQRAKGTPYEGGVNVPFIVSGMGVVNPGREADALISGVDLFPTLLEIAGFQASAVLPQTVIDGVSFAPLLSDSPFRLRRQFVYAEGRLPLPPAPAVRESWTVRDKRYKYIFQRATPSSGNVIIDHQLYDLLLDPLETNNLWVNRDFGLAPGLPPLIQKGLELRSTF